MKAAFRTPLTPDEVRAILAAATPERVDCALLRYTAPANTRVTMHNGGTGSSSE